MRAILNLLYRGTGALAALGLVGTLVFVATGIVSRPLGLYLRGTDAYAGYCMAACGFLALAYTFKHGEHIRVNLLLERLGPRMRARVEWCALAAGTVVAAALTWYSTKMLSLSHQYGDVSQGIDATPLWLPQIFMVVGTATFLIALLDDLVMRTLGREPVGIGLPGNEPVRME